MPAVISALGQGCVSNGQHGESNAETPPLQAYGRAAHSVAAIAEVGGVTILHYDRHFDAIARVTGQTAEWLAVRGTVD